MKMVKPRVFPLGVSTGNQTYITYLTIKINNLSPPPGSWLKGKTHRCCYLVPAANYRYPAAAAKLKYYSK